MGQGGDNDRLFVQNDGLVDEAPLPDVHPGGQDGDEQPEPGHRLVTKHPQVLLFNYISTVYMYLSCLTMS